MSLQSDVAGLRTPCTTNPIHTLQRNISLGAAWPLRPDNYPCIQPCYSNLISQPSIDLYASRCTHPFTVPHYSAIPVC